MSLLELRAVSVEYDESAVLTDVSLSVDEGELVLVTGPTGSGKSTLLGLVSGLVPRFSGGRLTGDALLDGRSVLDAPPRERAHVIGYVGQDPLAGFVTDTVEEELAYGMEQLGLPPETMRRRVEETLDLLGIAGLRDRDLRNLSGGQQQRVAIGSVLTMHPRLLVLDEPTSALDPRPPRTCWPPSPGWSTTSASRCCWPSTGWSGWCPSRTGSAWSATARSSSVTRPRCWPPRPSYPRSSSWAASYGWMS